MLLLLACSPEYDPRGVEPEDDPVLVDTALPEDEPDPYVYDELPDETEPLLTTTDLEDGIAQSIDVIFSLDPRPMHAIYEDTLDDIESDCPYFYDDYYTLYGYHYWYDTCSTGGGASFSGNGRHYSYDRYVDGYYDYAYRNYFYGSAKIQTEDGHTFTGAGYSYNYDYTNTSNGYRYFYSNMYGDFRWDGPEADGTWLAEDISMVSYLYANVSPEAGVYVSLESSLSGMSGPVNAAVFDGVLMYDEVRGSPCPTEPGGTISLRDAAGDWYDVEFHGPTAGSSTAFPPDCDGCGTAYWKGEYIGEVCPDFGGMMDWGTSEPWR
ncbi:MAG: hypothetical protein GY884_28605 [Proteobacteria bacterium]|nr:hypothetical protein [Pseudomonadota bacterium]